MMSTIHNGDYMMLWPVIPGIDDSGRVSIVWLLSLMQVVDELLRSSSKKACFFVRRTGDRGAGFAHPRPIAHLDLFPY